MIPYYDHGGITIYHGDNREIIPCLPQADHVITDPPYGEKTHKGARTNPNWNISGGNEPPVLITFDSIGLPVLRGLFVLSVPRRWCISFCDWHYVGGLEDDPPHGLRFVRFGVWIKPNGAPQFSGDRPGMGWEAVAIMHNADVGRMRWNGGGHTAVWRHNIQQGTGHPTAKPIALMRQLVQQFTDPGDLILDPFGGSGTTARACKDLNRQCILIERDERYCEIAARQLSQEVMAL